MNAAEKFLEEFGNIDDEFLEEAMNYTMKKKFNFKPIIAVAVCAALALAIIPVAKNFVNTPTIGTQGSTIHGTQSSETEKTGDNPIVTPPKKEYTALFSGSYNDCGGPIIKMDDEISLSGKGTYLGVAPKLDTVTIAGQTFKSPKSNGTDVYGYYDMASYKYIVTNGEKTICMFSMAKKSGKITEYILTGDGYEERFKNDENRNTKELSNEECIEVAKKLVESLGGDVEKFRVTENERKSSSTYGEYYSIKLTKYIGDTSTIEYLSAWITVYGEVVFYLERSIGAIEDDTILERQDYDAINAVIDEKVEKLYSTVADKFTYKKTGAGKSLIRLLDGRYALQCGVGVELTPIGEENPKIMKEILQLIIIIE